MKKKILSFVLALLMAVPSAAMLGAHETAEEAPRAEAERLLGDINNDKTVDIGDALHLFMHSMLPDQYDIVYPGAIDFDKNGSVDIGDALRLFMFSMLPDEYPIEWGVDPEKLGECGHIMWDKSDKMVGPMCLDSFQNQITRNNYSQKIKDGVLYVEETQGIFEISGWIGINFPSFELGWRIGTDNEEKFQTWRSAIVFREPAVASAAKAQGFDYSTGFRYMLDIAEVEDGDTIHLFMQDKTTDTIYCFNEITIKFKAPSETVDPAILAKYELGKDSDMDMSPYDPIAYHEPVTAPDDDPTVSLWFDHLTEKVSRYDLWRKDSGKTSYTIQMAKNEIEGCQFFLHSSDLRKVTIKVSDFENDKGEKLSTELGVEYYIDDAYNINGIYPENTVYPDAVVPYDSYIAGAKRAEFGAYGTDSKNRLKYGEYICLGSFTSDASNLNQFPFKDSLRGFVLQAETKMDTTPGAYKATIEIYDVDTGKCIKMANVYTYVYDVTLSDETALDTAFGLWDLGSIYEYHYSLNNKLTKYTEEEIARATSELFLKNRITLSSGLWYFETMGMDWFKNPRVTTIRVLTKEQYDLLKGDSVLAKKMYYYGQDEPAVPRGWRPLGWPDGTSETVYDNTGLLSVMAIAREADQLKNVWGWEDFRMMIPFERTIDFTTFDFNSVDRVTAFPEWYDEYAVTTEKDSIEYLKGYTNVWTPVFTGATPRELASAMYGTEYMQGINQDDIYGEFHDRLKEYQAEGDELWNYVACNPPYYAPYQNILLFNDGTEGRTMFWTTYMLGSTGFLYWHVSYYDAAGGLNYAMRSPFSKTGPGDGILVYPGSAFDQLDPIPSTRLLNMRDGIEDYQTLTMLRELKGEAYTDELVSHIVTSTVTFTRDDDVMYNVHSYLLRALEDASKN